MLSQSNPSQDLQHSLRKISDFSIHQITPPSQAIFLKIQKKIIELPDEKTYQSIKAFFQHLLTENDQTSHYFYIKDLLTIQLYLVNSEERIKLTRGLSLKTNKEQQDLKLTLSICQTMILQAAEKSLEDEHEIELTAETYHTESIYYKWIKKIFYWALLPAAFFTSSAQGIDAVFGILEIIHFSPPSWLVLIFSIIAAIVASALYYVFEVASLKEELKLDTNEELNNILSTYEQQAEHLKSLQQSLLTQSDDIALEDFKNYVQIVQLFHKNLIMIQSQVFQYHESSPRRFARRLILLIGVILSMGEAAYLVSGMMVGFAFFTGPAAFIILGLLSLVAAIFFVAGYADKIYETLNSSAAQINRARKSIINYSKNNLLKPLEKRLQQKQLFEDQKQALTLIYQENISLEEKKLDFIKRDHPSFELITTLQEKLKKAEAEIKEKGLIIDAFMDERFTLELNDSTTSKNNVSPPPLLLSNLRTLSLFPKENPKETPTVLKNACHYGKN